MATKKAKSTDETVVAPEAPETKPTTTAPEVVETPEVAETPEAAETAAATEPTEAPEASETSAEPETFAKAGKRSKKHLEEAQAEEARQERIAEQREHQTEEVKKGPKPTVRSLLERRGKKYQAAYKAIDRSKPSPLAAAIALAVKASPVNFDATVELHARLGVDPRQADQNIRSTVVLPHGSGKTIRVAVFAPDDQAKAAKAAGADIAGDETFLKSLDKGELNFDVLISTPAYMPKLGKYARVLGPKGLMPNPKAGTVTTDLEKAVKEAKTGKVEYRVDKQSIVHLGIGKVSFGDAKLIENAEAFLSSLKSQKPASIKGQYVLSLYVATTMGPSVPVENLYN
jgi:large subunit ribosomal protein L1